MNTPDESLAALLGLLSSVLAVALYVWTALAVSAMFRKMGEEPWKAWVPFLNTATLLKWGGFNPWLVLLLFVPVVQLVVFVLVVVSAHRLNPAFGYGNGMTVLAALLFVVWASILGFGPARWLGARGPRRLARDGPFGAGAAPGETGAEAGPVPARGRDHRSLAVAVPDPAGALWSPDAGAARDRAPNDAGRDAEAAGAQPTAAIAFAPPASTPPGSVAAPAVSGVPAAPASVPPSAVPASTPTAAGTPPATPAATPAPTPAPPVAAADAPRAAQPDDAGDHSHSADSEVPAVSDDSAWPSEVDDVSAIHASPFPPSPAGGRSYVAPPVSGMGDAAGPGAPVPPPAPIAFVPGRRAGESSPPPPAPVTRVPAGRRSAPDVGRPAASAETPVPAETPAPAGTPEPAEAGAARAAQPQPAVRRSDDADATPPAAIFAQPARARRAVDADDPDAFPELSGEVSAVVGSPSAGAPRSAVGAVSAQHRRHDEGDIDRPLGLAGGDASSDDDLLDQTVIARRSVRSAWELVPAAGTPVPLTASVVILGRRPSSDPAYPSAQLVAVPGEARTVSKTHARIEQRGDAWVVTDLGSTNGVLVRTLMGDEVEVEAGGTLDAGERFFLGDEEFHLRRTAH